VKSGPQDDLDQFVSNVLGRKREQLFWQLAAPWQPDALRRASACTWDIYHCHHLLVGKDSWPGHSPDTLILMTLGRSSKVVWCCAARRKPPSHSIPKPTWWEGGRVQQLPLITPDNG